MKQVESLQSAAQQASDTTQESHRNESRKAKDLAEELTLAKEAHGKAEDQLCSLQTKFLALVGEKKTLQEALTLLETRTKEEAREWEAEGQGTTSALEMARGALKGEVAALGAKLVAAEEALNAAQTLQKETLRGSKSAEIKLKAALERVASLEAACAKHEAEIAALREESSRQGSLLEKAQLEAEEARLGAELSLKRQERSRIEQREEEQVRIVISDAEAREAQQWQQQQEHDELRQIPKHASNGRKSRPVPEARAILPPVEGFPTASPQQTGREQGLNVTQFEALLNQLEIPGTPLGSDFAAGLFVSLDLDGNGRLEFREIFIGLTLLLSQDREVRMALCV